MTTHYIYITKKLQPTTFDKGCAKLQPLTKVAPNSGEKVVPEIMPEIMPEIVPLFGRGLASLAAAAPYSCVCLRIQGNKKIGQRRIGAFAKWTF